MESIATVDIGIAQVGVVRWLILGVIFAVLVYVGRRQLSWIGVASELGTVVPAYIFYFAVRAATEGGEARAMANSLRVLRFEEALGIAYEHRLQGMIINHQFLVDVANWLYIWGHWPVIVIVATWLFIRRPLAYRRLRNAFLFSGAIGLVIFMTFPVAPPRLADIGLIDTVSVHSNSYRVLQPPAIVNSYAAVPSLHFGWNLLIGIAVVQQVRNPAVRLFGVLSPVAMFFGIVLTANHYIVDAAAGAIVALTGLALAYSLELMGEREGQRGERVASPP